MAQGIASDLPDDRTRTGFPSKEDGSVSASPRNGTQSKGQALGEDSRVG